MSFIAVRHNIEVAHRLTILPGNKCESIHGHSMLVEMRLFALLNSTGLLGGLDFGEIKKQFREYLDTEYDHHLLLNEKDPWAGPVRTEGSSQILRTLPGLRKLPIDPTTENIATLIAQWGAKTFNHTCEVVVHETATNSAGVVIGRST